MKSDLGDAFWTDLAGDIIANTNTASRTNTLLPPEMHRFYRVIAPTDF